MRVVAFVDNKEKSILVIGDIHADEKGPKSRKDDYFEAICEKLEESVQLSVQLKVDALLILGDLFHKMEPSGKCRNRILSILQQTKKQKVRVIIVEGNHDNRNAPQNLPNSALGTLIQTNVVEYASEIPELGIGIGNYKPNIEESLRNGEYSGSHHLIQAFHANITVLPAIYEHILFSDIPLNPKCKLVLAGHVHDTMTAENENGVRFINPGALCRNELNNYNMTRSIQCVYVKYMLDGSELDIEFIPLQSAKPSKDIFNIEAVQFKKDESTDTKQYIQQITKMASFTTGNDKYISVKQSGKMKQVEPEVIDLVISVLKEVNLR